ncbi:MAG: thioredoxin family protein [Patescibacteria group bacterium]|nr:thioredoxin family protein [Patescibacteria group bacterium]
MKKILLFAVIVLIVAGGVWGFLKNKKTNSKETAKTEESQSQTQDKNGTVAGASTIKTTPGSDIVMFVGEGCPHCKKIEEYIKTNKIDEKVQFDLKEVWYNKDNAKVMQEKADVCKISKDNLGVPLLFDGSTSKCYVGEVEITDFFKSKTGAN